MILTINAPLILKMRDIIFFLRANYIMGHFKGAVPLISLAQLAKGKKSRP
jgi:hypothetical protein